MATKVFCDKCGQEIKDEDPWHSFITPETASVLYLRQYDKQRQTHTTYDASQDICKYCAIDTIKKLDDRPKVEPKSYAEEYKKLGNEIIEMGKMLGVDPNIDILAIAKAVRNQISFRFPSTVK